MFSNFRRRLNGLMGRSPTGGRSDGSSAAFSEDAVVARILRGTKAAGSALEAKTQHCYYVLLKVGGDFKYAALQHVAGDGINAPEQHKQPTKWQR